MSLDGILNANKPAGWTSFDVVAFVRGRSGQKRAGHAGTLDPFAEGVLPVCLGHATRMVEYLMDARKTYRAVVRLGRETDTYDRTGATVAEVDPSGVTVGALEHALETFAGEIEQRPPAYSALKRDGVPLYKLARAGQAVEAPLRRVTVYRIALLAFEPPLATIEVECSKGTYIRSLAHDLGSALGAGASLDALTRTRVGSFRIENAVEIEALRDENPGALWAELLYPPDEVVLDWPAAILAPENESRLRNGQAASLELARPPTAKFARAYNTDGEFFAVLDLASPGSPRPVKVFHPT